MSTGIRVNWLMDQLRRIMLPLVMVYFLLAGGTYNGSVLFSLQNANFIFFAVCGLGWLVWRFWRRRPFPATPLDAPLAAWLGAVLLAALLSTNQRLSLESVTANLVFVLVFYVVVDLARAGWSNESWQNAMILSSLVVLAFGLYEVGSWYQRWLAIGGLGDPIPPATMRVRATLGHPNIAAAYLNLVLPVALAIGVRRVRLRWWMLVWAAICLGLVFLTSSRGGWLGTAAALSSLALLLAWERREMVRRAWRWLVSHRWVLAGLVVVGLVVVGAVGYLLYRQAQHPTHAQGDQRGYIWVVATDMFKAHPIFGNGPGTYGIEFLRRYSIPPGMLLAHAHNFILNTLGEMGLVGVLALGWLTFALVWMAWHGWRSAGGEKRLLTMGLIAGLVGLAVHSQFDTPETVVVIDLLTAVILGLLAAEFSPQPAGLPERVRSWAAWPLWLGMAVGLGLWGYSTSGYAAYSQALQASYRGDWQQAAGWMDQSVAREPRLALYWFQDGFAHGMLALNPDGSLRDADELQKGLAAYEQGIQIEDGYALNWANLGWLRYRAGDSEGAAQACGQAALLANQSVDMLLICGNMLEELHHDHEARTLFEKALALQPDLRDYSFFTLSDLRREVKDGMPQPAYDPENGWDALSKNDFARANDLFSAQVGLNNSSAYLGWGLSQIGLGNYASAERILLTAQFMGADPLKVNDALVSLFEHTGDSVKLAQARSSVDELRGSSSVFGAGRLGESAYAWYVYHRESLPLDLLPGMWVGE